MSINATIRSVLPKGAAYRIRREPAGFGGMHVLRVITPAWGRLPVYKRVLKVTKALDNSLPATQRSKILRVSVLTKSEYEKLKAYWVSPRPHALKRIVKPTNGHR